MTQLKRYTIQQHDTIHQIARRELGHADQWWVLVRLNSLAFPYVDGSGPSTVPRVLGLGDTLLVPGNANDPRIRQVSAAATGEAKQYEVLLGKDLALGVTGDLIASTGSGDWRLEAGLENLLQALRHRLLTRKGELAYHPDYGSHLERHIGQPLDGVRLAAIRHEVRQTLLDDPRVTRIQEMTVDVQQDHVHIFVHANIIGQNDVVPLNLVLTKVAT